MLSHKKTFVKDISFSYFYISVYLITGILTTPMLLNHFEADYFALLMLIYAIITYLNNIRFGLPESLAALLAKSKDRSFNISMVKKNFLILILITFTVLILLFIVGFIISDWRIVLGDVYALNKDDVINVFYILIIFALLKIPLDISLSVFVGFHEVYLEKIYKIINPLVNFLLVLFVVSTGKSILFFAFWAGLFDFLVSLTSFIHVIIRYDILKENYTAKNINSVEFLKAGMLFFQLSLTQTIIWGIGIFFVSHMLSLESVTIYSLTMKIYIYIFYTYIIVNSVVAPLYGKYFSDNNWNEIKKIFNLLTLLLPFLGGFIWIGTLYFMSNIITLWTGSIEFYIGHLFVFIIGIFFYFIGYINSYITLLYSIGEIKNIIYIRWKEVVVNLSVTFIAIYFMGVVGVAIGMSLAIVLVSVSYLPKYVQIASNGEINLNFSIQKKHFLFVLLPNIVIAFSVTYFVEIFLIKLLFFVVMSTIYMLSSWHMLPAKDKVYIMSLLNYKKGIVEKQ